MNICKALLLVTTLVASAGSAWGAPTTLWITSVAHDCAFAPDDTIRVDLMLNSINAPIDLAGVEINYPSAELGFIRAERGALTAAWPTFNVTDVLIGPGAQRQVIIDAMSPTPIPAGVSGQFATLVFVATACATPSNWNLPLCVAQAYGDFAGLQTVCGSVRIFSSSAGRLSVETFYQTCGSALGDTVEIDVRIDDSLQPIDAAGLDISYEPGQLEYVGYKRGDLTVAWPFFDAAHLPQSIRVGGFTQTPIPGGSTGVFVTLRFVATCCDGGQTAVLLPGVLVDDFAAMTTLSGAVHCVPLATRPSTWGYVKSLYRQ